MPKKDDEAAKSAIIKEFDAWAPAHSDAAKGESASILFYGYLRKERPQLLQFQVGKEDKLQTVRRWLEREHRIKGWPE